MKVAVMGCIVNGPGESKHADIGISLPGTGEAPAAPVFIDGEKALTLRGERHRRASSRRIVESYIEKRFGAADRRASARRLSRRSPARPRRPRDPRAAPCPTELRDPPTPSRCAPSRA